MFGTDNIKTVVVPLIGDLSGGTYPVFMPAQGVTIKSARVIPTATLAGGTANYYSIALQNLGTAGAGTVAVAAAIGGTPGWTALTAKSFTITAANKKVAEDEVVAAVYTETGTVNTAFVAVEINYIDGLG